MHNTTKLLCASLFTISALFAQDGPPPGPGGPGGHGPGMGPMPPLVTGAPFSAVKTDTHQETLSDGNVINQTRTENVYRDTNGRMRTESTMTTPSGTTRTMITIVDPVAGFIAHLNPADSTAFKMTLPAPPSGTPPTPPSPPAAAPQTVKTDLGASTINGLAVTGERITRTIPAGTMGNTEPIIETREVYTSTALKIPVKMTSTDPRHGTSTMTLTNVSQSAPDPSLFQIPSTYTVKDAPAHHGPGGPGGPPPPPPSGTL